MRKKYLTATVIILLGLAYFIYSHKKIQMSDQTKINTFTTQKERASVLVKKLSTFFKAPDTCQYFKTAANQKLSYQERDLAFKKMAAQFISLQLVTQELKKYVQMDSGQIEVNEAESGMGREILEKIYSHFCPANEEDFELAQLSIVESQLTEKNKFYDAFFNRIVNAGDREIEQSIGLRIYLSRDEDKFLIDSYLEL